MSETTVSSANAVSLEREIEWFGKVLDARIAIYFQHENASDRDCRVPPPALEHDKSEFARLVKELGLGFDERIVLILALLPHVRPQILDTFFIRNKNVDREFTEFGGWKGKNHSGFLPTCETVAFILAGDDLGKRFDILRLFEPDHLLVRQDIIRIDHPGTGEPFFSGALCISTEYLNRFTSGVIHKPDYSITFPAKRITTQLTWNDLVLAPYVMEEIEHINVWIHRNVTILREWGLDKTVKPGYRSLFYGPPGTGKTLTATLLGAAAGIDVYRIDLSMVVSKYIGETEKNLANVFDQALHKNWILFFDEADSLFGKRTGTTNSNDRHANQEISYLLQRVEDFAGVVILATNLQANIDDAFSRRFQSMVFFPMPDADQRLRLWNVILDSGVRLAPDVDLESLAKEYEISGGAITNVVLYSAICATQKNQHTIQHNDLVRGITRELRKEWRTN